MKRKKQNLLKPVLLGFAVLYVAAMGLTTWLVELKYKEEFRQNYRTSVSHACDLVKELEENMPEEMPEECKNSLRLAYFSSPLIHMGGTYQQFSGALYDQDGKKLTESRSCLAQYDNYYDGKYYTYYVPVSDYLTEEEAEQLAGYVELVLMDNTAVTLVEAENAQNVPKDLWTYRFILYTDSESRKLYQIYVQKIWLSTEGTAQIDPFLETTYSYYPVSGTDYQQVENEVVWQWQNPDLKDVKYTIRQSGDLMVAFPYMTSGYDAWKQWEENSYLHDFPSEWKAETGSGQNKYEMLLANDAETGNRLKQTYIISLDDGTDYTLILAADSHPWIAAMDYMKYVYLACFALMVACMAAILSMIARTDRQRTALEEMQRDFTNAMAHELKTPLGVIRGFAENLLERTMEEKRDYYLTQIIGQTEEMDRMVAELITVSRVESEHLVLPKEPVSMSGLFREQMERFRPVLEEKRLQVSFECGEDFVVEGDRDYLEKAVWNLISNAVCYNVPDGSILVRTGPSGCSIENTGFALTKEQLAHAFDLFYSGEESRSARGKHMGLGLFLTKKILEFHQLKITLENTENGVRVSIMQ